jgi:hypothetical protein
VSSTLASAAGAMVHLLDFDTVEADWRDGELKGRPSARAIRTTIELSPLNPWARAGVRFD